MLQAGAVALLCVLVAGLGIWGATERSRADDAQALLDDRRDAALAASSFVEALLTYEFDALDAQQEAINRGSTERFRDDYRSAFNDDLRAAIEAEEASSTVSIRDVFVTADGDDQVRVIVHADSQVASARGSAADVESYLEITLLRRDGRWLVDEMVSLGSRDVNRREDGG